MQPSKTPAEERVDRIRASLSSTLLPAPSSSTVLSSTIVNGNVRSDGNVRGDSSRAGVARSRDAGSGMASMIAAYGKSKEAVEETAELGARAYLLKHNPSSVLNGGGDRRVTELNKTFLQNTIRSVESHNRREQIDSAWRQHDLLKRLDRGELCAPQKEGNDDQGHSTSHSSPNYLDSPDRTTSHRSSGSDSSAEERNDEDQDSVGERSSGDHGGANEEEEDFMAFSIDRSSSPTGPERPKKLNRFLKNTISSVSSHNRRLLRRAAATAREHAAAFEASAATNLPPLTDHINFNNHSTHAAKFPIRNKNEEREEGEEEEEEVEEPEEQGGEEEAEEISFELDRSKELPSHLYTGDQKLYSARTTALSNRVTHHSRSVDSDDRRIIQERGEKRRRSESPPAHKRRRSSPSEASDSDHSSSSSSKGRGSEDSGSESDGESRVGDRSRSTRSASRERTRDGDRDRDDRGGGGASREKSDGAGVDYQAQREMWALRKAQALHNGVYVGTPSAGAASVRSTDPDRSQKDQKSQEKESRREEKKSKKDKKDKKDKKEKKEKKAKKEKKEKKDKHEKKSKHGKHRH